MFYIMLIFQCIVPSQNISTNLSWILNVSSKIYLRYIWSSENVKIFSFWFYYSDKLWLTLTFEMIFLSAFLFEDSYFTSDIKGCLFFNNVCEVSFKIMVIISDRRWIWSANMIVTIGSFIPIIYVNRSFEDSKYFEENEKLLSIILYATNMEKPTKSE